MPRWYGHRLSRNFMANHDPADTPGRQRGHPVLVAGGRLTLQLLPRAPYSARDPAHAQSIGVALERQTGVHAIGSDQREPFDRWPGTLAVTPAGVDVFSESPIGGEYLVLRCESELDLTCSGNVEGTRVCIAGARDAFTLARDIRRALLAPMLDEPLIEALAWRLAALGAASPRERVAPRAKAGRCQEIARDRNRYAPALARIADAFDQPLAIDELAAMTDQSPLAFLRGFTSVVGLTPHAYLIEQRLQAARCLLADARRSLTDVALACGFSHQSHFGNAFKRTFGLTPDHYRRLLGVACTVACQRK